LWKRLQGTLFEVGAAVVIKVKGMSGNCGGYREHRPRLWILLLLVWMAFAWVPQARAGDNDQISGQAAELTKYLHDHRLPLVSAQLLTNADGTREVVLYGFTATDFGKQDAVTKIRRYLKDSTIAVSNRIKVRPELENQTPAGAASTARADAGSADAGSATEYSGQEGAPEASAQPADPQSGNLQKQSQRDIQSYAAQQQPSYPQQGGMGGGPGMSFGGNGMGMTMSGGGMGALLGLLGGASGSSPLMGLLGGAGSYGSGQSGYGYGAAPGYGSSYGSSNYGSPGGYGSGGYGAPPYGGGPGYSPGGYPSGNGNPYPY
jgi:hypothetical protein